MFKSYWGMEFNPFDKTICENNRFESSDLREMLSRLKHLQDIRGIGLFTGLPGTGKTYALRCFKNSLNPNLYRTVYLPMSTLTVMEFYRSLAIGLGLSPAFKKIDLFNDIQDRIRSLYKDKKITPVIILDEAQYLNSKILNDLKLLLNFDMDSKNYAILILAGLPILNNTLSLNVYEALKQRIVIKYMFSGISKKETVEYLSSRLSLCGANPGIFSDSAIEAIYACSNGSPRILNNIIQKCLILGAQKQVNSIDIEIVMGAQNEVELA